MDENTHHLVELRGLHKFPEDVAAAEGPAPLQRERLRVETVTAFAFTDYDGEYQFAISKAQTAATLRKIADRLEAGLILPQRVQVTSEALRADYTRSALILEFCEKKFWNVQESENADAQ